MGSAVWENEMGKGRGERAWEKEEGKGKYVDKKTEYTREEYMYKFRRVVKVCKGRARVRVKGRK